MALSTFITAADLDRWAGTRDGQETLPLLVRRLVQATAPTVERSGFPGGDSIHRPGWDGIVIAREATTFVPGGASAWELGVSADSHRKAKEDYDKRTKNSDGFAPAEATYIAVTSRVWTKKQVWEKEIREEGVWKDVRVYDADDLEQWLELAPAVHYWLSHRLGKHPEGAEDVEHFWAAYAAATSPSLPEGLILAGREETVAAIHGTVRTKRPTVALRGQTRAEALGVIVSALLVLPNDEREAMLAHTLVVHDAAALRHLATTPTPLIVIPTFDEVDVGRVIAGGHQLLQAVEGEQGRNATADALPPIAREAAEKALKDAGIAERTARDLARLATRSFGAFRRKIAARPETECPQWAEPAHALALTSALLLGSWHAGKPADRDALESIGRASYDALTTGLRRWLHEADSPLREVGDTWFFPAKEDVWLLLGGYITADQLKDFRSVAVRVLSVPDPKWDLPRDDQWAAAVTKHVPAHSGELAYGIAESLAILGTRGGTILHASGITGEDVAAVIVGEILTAANRDWRIWASLSQVLPLLAEAAPDTFLSAVESGLAGDDPTLAHIFLPDDASFTAPTPHTGLLWALERLAWSPTHLPRIALALARLAERDPGGKSTNRPHASLRAIFLPWFPQTAAGLGARLSALDLVRKRSPGVAWKVLFGLLPQDYDVPMPGSKPEWREWVPEADPAVTTGDLMASAHEIANRLLEDARMDTEHLVQLIDAAPKLPAADRTQILNHVRSLESALDPLARAKVWNTLRDIVAQHRSFAGARWALEAQIVEDFSALLPLLEPTDPVQRSGWLFAHNAHLTDPPSTDFEEQRRAVQAMQETVVRDLYENSGVQAVFKFARGVALPENVGAAMAKLPLPDSFDEECFREHLNGPDLALSRLAHAIAWFRLSVGGLPWLRSWLAVDPPLPGNSQAVLFAKARADSELFALVEGCPEDVQTAYWRTMLPYGVSGDDAEQVADRLLAHNRPHAALELLATHHRRKLPLDAVVCARVLERLVHPEDGDDGPGQIDAHSIGELLDAISEPERLPLTRVATLEWAFLPALGRFIRRPKLLHRALAENPDFFIEMLSIAYRGEGDERRDLDPKEAGKARAAYELLDTWHFIPGTTENGIESGMLREWIIAARAAAATARRSGIADIIIGQMIGGATMGDPWPPPAVCDVLEYTETDELHRGFQTGVMNTRGAFWKSMGEGGKQERDLAAMYRAHAEAIADRWPRAAAVVRGIADDYERHGRRADEQTKLREGLED